MSASINLPAGIKVFERGWLSSNNILFIGRGQSTLVDSGYVTHAPQTVALVKHALAGQPLDRLINTHLHSDHCGGNAALQQAYAVRTTIPAAEAEPVRTWDEQALSFRATGQHCDRFTFDDTLQPGDTLILADRQWQALAAPGHDPHSLLLYCAAERILISADALWQNGFGVIFPELQGESGFAEAHATLQLIAGLDVALVIPGHGAPFTDVKTALDTAFSRLAWLSADPLRNAENAIKVLLKFMLLERQRIALDALPAMLAGARLFEMINQRYFQLTQQQLADWMVARLVRASAARIENNVLVDVS
jgi:glyoxylase-like metal-dependent hydrolase (beta-lactamase superfamily II)